MVDADVGEAAALSAGGCLVTVHTIQLSVVRFSGGRAVNDLFGLRADASAYHRLARPRSRNRELARPFQVAALAHQSTSTPSSASRSGRDRVPPHLSEVSVMSTVYSIRLLVKSQHVRIVNR